MSLARQDSFFIFSVLKFQEGYAPTTNVQSTRAGQSHLEKLFGFVIVKVMNFQLTFTPLSAVEYVGFELFIWSFDS